jgi:catechol 2,3-dioxygenase-like lactoylglutathione lyase family enzyme
MELSGVHHVSLNVNDVGEALPLYVDVLGLKMIPRPDFGFPGAWLEVADGRQVHLIEVDDFVPDEGQHFAFAVDDLDAAIAHLDDNDVKHTKIFEIPGTPARQAFFRDATGNSIELNQPA